MSLLASVPARKIKLLASGMTNLAGFDQPLSPSALESSMAGDLLLPLCTRGYTWRQGSFWSSQVAVSPWCLVLRLA
jgi:hypothetical protein